MEFICRVLAISKVFVPCKD